MKEYLRILTLYAGLFSCTSEPITSGTVTSKWHEPEQVYTVSTEDYWTGKEIKMTLIDDEDYILVLQQFGGTKFKQTRERQIYVPKNIYDLFKVGDHVNLLKAGIRYEDMDKDVEQK